MEKRPCKKIAMIQYLKLELYRLIGEGYKAMQEGRTSTIEEVREKLEKRRKERG